MDKAYNHKDYEEKIYSLWEKSGAFKPVPITKDHPPFTILMPPPNANASLHAGHAMYTVEDILTRFKRMQGFSALWLPGMDHAGFETQYVYEKHLAKEGKSRLDFDRNTLHKNIEEFVKNNSGLIYQQFKRLGFSADWERSVYAADSDVIDYVYKTFTKMESEGYVYRDNYIVNYCTHCGTSLAELEVVHEDREDRLFYIKYKFAGNDEFITVATVRPETIFADVTIAVHPKDKRYKDIIGKNVLIPIINKEIPIIVDQRVEMEFGTGVLKITPAHDPTDYVIGKEHDLNMPSIIDLNGRMKVDLEWLNGKKVKEARELTVEKLQRLNQIEKIDEHYSHAVTVCYKCKRDLEPTLTPNWFIKVEKLKAKVKEVVEQDKIKFFPKMFKKHMLSWLEIMHDWPISRQIVWCIRIPVWYDTSTNPNIEVSFIDKNGIKKTGKITDFDFNEVEKGLQTVSAPVGTKYIVSVKKPEGKFLPETDTFDTWFSSGQWPLVTLKGEEFETRFPTDVMGTLSEILKFWVSRMIMFSLYLKDEIPFKDVYLWSMVADKKGVKMSKSKNNVVNPLEVIEKYGADALRMSLIYGTPAGSKIIFSEEKVRGMRNFANKIWNAARFVKENLNEKPNETIQDPILDKKIKSLIKDVSKYLDKYQLNRALEEIYESFWHWFCDECIERSKTGEVTKSDLFHLLINYLKLLHPFAPFVTETIWQELKNLILYPDELLIIAPWPASK